jgi:hypothetical protein
MFEDMEDTTKTADDMSLTKAQTFGKGIRLIFLECGSVYGSGSRFFFGNKDMDLESYPVLMSKISGSATLSFAKEKYEKHVVVKKRAFIKQIKYLWAMVTIIK